MRSNTLFLALPFVTGALAANQIISMYIPGTEGSDFLNGTDIAVEVLGSQSSTTTYLLTCFDDDCDIPGGTIIQGPGTVSMLASDDSLSYTASVICTHDDKKATCSGGMVGDDVETETEDVTSIPVTITGTASVSSTPAAASASATSTIATSTASSSSSSETQGANSTSGGAGAEETGDNDNGAVSQVAGARFGAALVALGVAAFAML
ncbi:hypothetical protein BJX64DRAFT_295081 [Aspergillus heterothallicus]